ncbi:MAG TPA: 16S rRNA (guanine(527)-N(7))-methyltransferase RsmG [Stellaceae bacterium]|nr:16S rRNA (guanine(527)-N(7))-methyltransferase RsmG [Stellaceae bacterium]
MNVSRETLDRLIRYVDLLTAWNARINLVGRNTMGDIWRRHILDSAQLYPHLPQGTRLLIDLGSGAGLPGLVLSILGVAEVQLVESDSRKAIFLREAARVTGAPATVHALRLDRVKPLVAQVVTARALAPVAELLEISERFRAADTICLFLKGENVQEELTTAAKRWNMTAHQSPSLSDPSGCILRLENISRDPSAGSR